MPDFTLINPYDSPGQWYRGNLHTHTSASDGRNTPEAMAQWYAQHGYDFLALTDHHRITLLEGFQSDMLLIPGAEIGSVDVVAIGIRGALPEDSGDIAHSVRLAKQLGGIAFVAHPYWWGLSADRLAQHPGLIGLEVFNNVCHYLNGKGLSSSIWDELLQRGLRLWGLAADDAHGLDESRFGRSQVGQAWVMVKAAAKEERAILQALRRGAFYSTQAPSILAVNSKAHWLQVRCSPVREIRFIGQTTEGDTIPASPGGLLEQADYQLQGSERYIRIECVDEAGRTAWSNPLWLDTGA